MEVITLRTYLDLVGAAIELTDVDVLVEVKDDILALRSSEKMLSAIEQFDTPLIHSYGYSYKIKELYERASRLSVSKKG